MARPSIDPKKLEQLARKRELIKRARKIAKIGSYSDFEHVRRQFEEDDALTLKLWASATEREEIDTLCAKAKFR